MATPEQAAQWIAIESDDYDGLGGSKGFGWARATTDDVAAGIGVSTEEAYRLLKAAARKKLVWQDTERRKGVTTGRYGSSQVGWAIWEVHLDRAQTREREGEDREPEPRTIAFHRDAATEDIVRGEQVPGKALISAADASGIAVDSKLERLLNKAGIWVRPGITNLSTDAANEQAIQLYREIQAANSLTRNSSQHYVWVLTARSDEPLSSEGPFGPYTLSVADQFARIGASEGVHDRAVSLGKDPEARGFQVLRRYAARSGLRLV